MPLKTCTINTEPSAVTKRSCSIWVSFFPQKHGSVHPNTVRCRASLRMNGSVKWGLRPRPGHDIQQRLLSGDEALDALAGQIGQASAGGRRENIQGSLGRLHVHVNLLAGSLDQSLLRLN